jgi:steroid delta-isomerase-like uncharacterized protein
MIRKLFVAILLVCIGNFALAQSNVIEAHYKAINAHDAQTVASGYTEDAQLFSPNWEGAEKGIEGAKGVFSRYFKSTPDLSYTVTNTINANDAIVVEYTFSGTLSAPEAGTPDYMKGKKYTLQGCAIFQLKDNKIVKETDYFDQVAFLRQVGFFDQNR